MIDICFMCSEFLLFGALRFSVANSLWWITSLLFLFLRERTIYLLFTSVSMGLCECMQMCVGVHACALVSVGCHPLSLSAYSFEAGPLPEPRVYIFSLRLEASKPQAPPCFHPPQNCDCKCVLDTHLARWGLGSLLQSP